MKAFRLQILKLIGYTLFVFSVLILGSNALYVFSASKNDEEMLKKFYRSEQQARINIEIKNVMDITKNSLNEIQAEVEEIEEEIEATPVYEEPADENYIAVLSIPKIGLKRGLYRKDYYKNSIEYNVTIHEKSDTPEDKNGNVILMAHSGTGNIAFFKDVYKLDIGDTASIEYNGKKYTYKIVNMYDVPKTGTVEIKRNHSKNVMTIITCRHGTNNQIVVILELYDVV